MADAKVAILNVVPQNRGAPQHNAVRIANAAVAKRGKVGIAKSPGE